MIQLHPHGQTAYNSILHLLPETHKAAVIHPTGTGKSFIAFRLAEQYADKRFVWLPPSEMIFKTQCQNIERAYGYKLENVVFVTYAKLSYASDLVWRCRSGSRIISSWMSSTAVEQRNEASG